MEVDIDTFQHYHINIFSFQLSVSQIGGDEKVHSTDPICNDELSLHPLKAHSVVTISTVILMVTTLCAFRGYLKCRFYKGRRRYAPINLTTDL